MQSITREFLIQRHKDLERQYRDALALREQASATVNAVVGALQENDFLQSQLDEQKVIEFPKPNEPDPDPGDIQPAAV